jgi:hypothetical protein
LPPLHIGIDLDNTIIDYEHVFGEIGVDIGLLPAGLGLVGKEQVKGHLLAQSEDHWMRLQGQVYGRFIGRARPYRGVRECMLALRECDARVSIVSHKTRLGHFDDDRLDLWEAARGWLTTNGFIGAGVVAADDVHFLETRESKIARIAELDCDAFIDDLAEVLLHPDFPRPTLPIWFADTKAKSEGHGLPPFRTWEAIRSKILSQD